MSMILGVMPITCCTT